ncbi:signal transduction histidine kinase [Actinophytocola oryzae]|uniref:histidine kinase n=1 Tax=Actinophytocola oryzae TaxID=502181 RepID=A0A4R7VXJ5_9PSEU|nr:signal transduction histidine kinase [Actinophytocola oryzae]
MWREPRPTPGPPRLWWDWVLVSVLATAALLEGLLRQDLSWRVLSLVICVGLVATLLWRRSRPLLMVAIAFGVCMLGSVVVGGDFPKQDVLVYLVLLPFSLLRWGSGRDAVLGAALILAKIGFSGLLGYLSPGDTLAGVVVVFAVMAIGAAFRYRTRARARELDQAKLLERERLARDLHDTVAHHVSAMAIRAQAGIATAATDPNAAVDALKIIDAEAARALDEMRGMVRILRTEDPVALTPGPRLTDLERLASTSDPRVEVTVEGGAQAVASPVGAAVFRLAQEAVTNARRHARHATRIEVRVVVDDTSVHVRVSDDGEPGLLRPSGAPGYGLTGMIERASLLGGTCEAGPNADRGWTVNAVLPRTGVS